jgi:hypothetical protein
VASIQTGIQLNDQFSTVINNIINSVNLMISTVQDMSQTMNTDIDSSAFDAMRDSLDQATEAADKLNEEINNINPSEPKRKQEEFNESIQRGTNDANELASAFNRIGTAIGSMFAIQKVIGFIDDCTDATDTQLNAQTQLAGVIANTGGGQEAYDALVDKAQEIQQAGMYGDEAMIGAAAEFATYMNDTSAVELMMDTLTNYAAGMSGGGEVDYTSMVDYATNLGKITTGSYDAMTKKGFEFTDAQKAVIDGTATESQYVEALGEDWQSMSDDMRSASVISDVINESWDNLYATMSNTPEAQLQSIENSFGDIQEMVGSKLYNGLAKMYAVIANNMPMIQSVMLAAADGLNVIIAIISDLIQGVADVAGFIQNNWSVIEPVIWGIVAALAVYGAYLAITNGIEIASAVATAAHSLAMSAKIGITAALTGSTMAATAAQMGYNGALYACPIVWIIALIIALIAIFYAAVAAVNKFAGTSYSATGIIMAVFAVLAAYLINKFVVPVWNTLASLANFFGNLFNDPVAAVKVLFYDMCLSVIGYIATLARGIEDLLNKIPGVTVDITSGLDNFYSGLEQAQQAVKDESGWVEYVGKMDYVDYSDAAQAGYSFGEGIEDSVSNFSLTDALGIGNSDVLDMSSYSGLTDALNSSTIADSTSETADSTDSIADSLSVTDEELKYLRDIAEQETINRYTTAEINVDMSGMQNTVNSGDDIDGFMTILTDSVGEAIDNMTEGVHV